MVPMVLPQHLKSAHTTHLAGHRPAQLIAAGVQVWYVTQQQSGAVFHL